MKKATETLFLGGPWDGRRVVVRDDRIKVVVPPKPAPLESMTGKELIVDKPDTVDYFRQRFGGETKQIPVFVVDGMSGDDALELLVSGYKIANKKDHHGS